MLTVLAPPYFILRMAGHHFAGSAAIIARRT